MESPKVKYDAILYSQCGHFMPMKDLKAGGQYQWKAKYDYCPDCVEVIEKKQDELQTTFEGTFDAGKERG